VAEFSPGYTRCPVSPALRRISIPTLGGLPASMEWSFGLQRQVIRDLVGKATYVGNAAFGGTAGILTNYNANTGFSLKAMARYQ